jgi:hypothetical protein
MDFIATDAILTVQAKPESNHPLIKANSRVFHHSPGLKRELPLLMMRRALPATEITQVANLGASASRTSNPIRPAPRDKVGNAVIGISEIDDCFLKSGWFACHDSPFTKRSVDAS